MKKIILLLLTAAFCLPLHAQNINAEGDNVRRNNNSGSMQGCCGGSAMSHWCIDVNLTGGMLMQDYSAVSPAAGYTNSLNTQTSSLKFNSGASMGADAEIGYFFGKKRHFGIGTGVMYMYQMGDLTMDHFHVEYQSSDNMGGTFRQLLTSDGKVKESLKINNFNIPLLFKYKTQFTNRIGFTVDAGVLFNLVETNNYTSKSSFDYEAIYKYDETPEGIIPVYDNNATPGASDLLITKSKYASSGYNNIPAYFNELQSHGYNVGLGVNPYKATGNVSYTAGTIGLLVRPAISIAMCHRMSLNLGVYYLYQDFNNTAASNYRITDKIGQYSSMLNTVTSSMNNSYGLSVGVRYCLGKRRCPQAPPAAGEAPVIAPVEEEPPVASPTAVEEQPEPEENVNVSTPILFDFNKTSIHPSSYPILEEAVKELQEDPNATVTVHGYTDSKGGATYNKILSKRRANSVKNYLRKKGVNAKSVKTVGHGTKDPAATNKTPEGRAKNRRAVMKMNESK